MVSILSNPTAAAPPTTEVKRGTFSKSRFSGVDSFAEALDQMSAQRDEEDRDSELDSSSMAASQQQVVGIGSNDYQNDFFENNADEYSEYDYSLNSVTSSASYESENVTSSQNDVQQAEEVTSNQQLASTDSQGQVTSQATGNENQAQAAASATSQPLDLAEQAFTLVQESTQTPVTTEPVDITSVNSQAQQSASQVTTASSSQAAAVTVEQPSSNPTSQGDAAASGVTTAQETVSATPAETAAAVNLQQTIGQGTSQTGVVTDAAAASASTNSDGVEEITAVKGNSQSSGTQESLLSNYASGNETANTATVSTVTNEPARLSEARSAEILKQVSLAIEQLNKTGQNTLRLQLNPQDLGKIDLQVSQTSEGMRVIIRADQEKTSQILENGMDSLRQSLQDAGIQLSQLSVGQQNSQKQSGYSWTNSQSSSRSRYKQEQAASTVVNSVKTTAAVRSTSSLIDYQV